MTSGFERGQAGNLGAERQDQVRLRPGLQHHQGDLGIRGCPQVRPGLQGLVQEDLWSVIQVLLCLRVSSRGWQLCHHGSGWAYRVWSLCSVLLQRSPGSSEPCQEDPDPYVGTFWSTGHLWGKICQWNCHLFGLERSQWWGQEWTDHRVWGKNDSLTLLLLPVYLYLSIHTSICLFVYLSIHKSVHSYKCLFVCPSINFYIFLSVCLSINFILCECSFVYPSTSLCVSFYFLSVSLTVSFYFCMYFCLSVYLSACLSFYLSPRLFLSICSDNTSVCLSIRSSQHLPPFSLSVHWSVLLSVLSMYPSVSPSIGMSFHLSIHLLNTAQTYISKCWKF